MIAKYRVSMVRGCRAALVAASLVLVPAGFTGCGAPTKPAAPAQVAPPPLAYTPDLVRRLEGVQVAVLTNADDQLLTASQSGGQTISAAYLRPQDAVEYAGNLVVRETGLAGQLHVRLRPLSQLLEQQLTPGERQIAFEFVAAPADVNSAVQLMAGRNVRLALPVFVVETVGSAASPSVFASEMVGEQKTVPLYLSAAEAAATATRLNASRAAGAPEFRVAPLPLMTMLRVMAKAPAPGDTEFRLRPHADVAAWTPLAGPVPAATAAEENAR